MRKQVKVAAISFSRERSGRCLADDTVNERLYDHDLAFRGSDS